MADRNKIATELSAEDLQEFLDRCWKTPGLTLKAVQDLAGEYGIAVSLMGAKTFRDTTFSRHLQRIGKAGELANQVAALRQAGAGHTIADAAAAILSDEVLAKLVNRDDDDELDLDTLSKIIQRMRAGDARLRALEHKIATDREDAVKRVLAAPTMMKEIAAISGDKKLSDAEKSARIQLRLFGERPANFKAHTATGGEG